VKHVLVVEDDAVNAVLFRKLLERRGGFRVTVTDSPDEVMATVREGGVSLVVMDVSLVDSWWEGKQVNGVDMCRLLKTDPHTVGMPVILATAHAMRGDMERLLSDSGADDYVAKPIVDHDKFLEQIRRWVQSEAA
jgi:two-component system, cell cycle response regulator DivK